MDKRKNKTIEEVKTEVVKEISYKDIEIPFSEFERTMKKIVKAKPEKRTTDK